MSELTLQLDNTASKSLAELMHHYNVKSKAELISKALSVLKIAAHVDQTQGELFARKGAHETRILVR